MSGDPIDCYAPSFTCAPTRHWYFWGHQRRNDHDGKPPESTRHSQKRLTARLAAKAA